MNIPTGTDGGQPGYEGIIWDLDGVLLDSVSTDLDYDLRVRMDTAEELGWSMDHDEYNRYVNRGTRRELENYLKEEGVSWEHVREIKENLQEKKRSLIRDQQLEVFENVDKTLEELHSSGVAMGIVTNAEEYTAEVFVETHGFEEYFDFVGGLLYDNFEVFLKRKKPSPYLIEQAIEKLPADNFLVIGDSENDVKAGHNAGVDAVLLSRAAEDRETSADYIIHDIREIPEREEIKLNTDREV
ncbi:MAG: HAD family hydrolase [Candidatus Nanohaloarchaea archaeon]